MKDDNVMLMLKSANLLFDVVTADNERQMILYHEKDFYYILTYFQLYSYRWGTHKKSYLFNHSLSIDFNNIVVTNTIKLTERNNIHHDIVLMKYENTIEALIRYYNLENILKLTL